MLAAVKKGARVVCGGIHMSEIPPFPYKLLWEEREVVCIANLTRADGNADHGVHRRYSLSDANQALAVVRDGRIEGAAVLVP